MRLVCVCLLLCAGTAAADRHVVQRGETLERIAQAHGCSVETVMRANELRTTLVKPGTAIDIPSCSLRARARVRTTTRSRPTTEDAKAKAALAVIDGATWVEPPRPRDDGPARSTGEPWDGALVGGEQLPQDAGYRVRRPARAYGAGHVIEHLRGAIAIVRALYPDVHTLAIGDLSAEHGGKLASHRSHQSGLDVDVGFFFKRVPEGYPEHFVAANADLDLAATWALVTAFARTTELADGVEVIFLDYAVQKRLYTWARARGTPDDDLAHLLQYPRDKDTRAGLVRHWANHADHLHVRFKTGR